MEKEKFDIDKTASSLSVKASAGGNVLELEEIVYLAENTDAQDDDIKRRVVGEDLDLLQFQMPVPGKRHKDIGHDEQSDGVELLQVLHA